MTLLYIDAGTGGMLLQALAAGAVGAWLMLRSRFAKPAEPIETNEEE